MPKRSASHNADQSDDSAASRRKKRRRSSGEGAVFQRKDGLWVGEIDLGIIDGKRRRKTVYGKTKKEATEKLRQLAADHAQGKNILAEKQTLKQFLMFWLDEIASKNVRVSTLHRYRQLITLHIIPALGHLPLDQVQPGQVQNMINTLPEKGLSAQTIHHVRAVLRTALNTALKFGYVTRNAAALVDSPRIEKQETLFLTPEQARLFLNTVKGHRLEHLYRLALSLALRRGELLALRWSDIDLEHHTLKIRTSKTAAGARTLSLTPSLVKALHEHWSVQQQERLVQGVEWKEHGLVFPSEKGTPMAPRNLHRHFKSVLKRAGLPSALRFHDLRHSCASFLVAEGEHPRVVMHILRHTNISTSMNIYAHISPDLEKGALDKIDQILGNDQPEDDKAME
jgi:integrase